MNLISQAAQMLLDVALKPVVWLVYQMGDTEMTKKEANARKLAWTIALSEGRVLKYDAGKQLTSYPTIEARDIALAAAKAVGFPCEVVKVQS